MGRASLMRGCQPATIVQVCDCSGVATPQVSIQHFTGMAILRTIVPAFIRRVGRGTVKAVKRMKEKFGLSEGEFTELQREIREELKQKPAADEGSPNPHTAASTVLNNGETI